MTITEYKSSTAKATPSPIGGTQGTENGQVKKPQGITLDSSGKVYVKDVGNTGFRYLLQMPVIRQLMETMQQRQLLIVMLQ
jgi:hypothetical protein